MSGSPLLYSNLSRCQNSFGDIENQPSLSAYMEIATTILSGRLIRRSSVKSATSISRLMSFSPSQVSGRIEESKQGRACPVRLLSGAACRCPLRLADCGLPTSVNRKSFTEVILLLRVRLFTVVNKSSTFAYSNVDDLLMLAYANVDDLLTLNLSSFWPTLTNC